MPIRYLEITNMKWKRETDEQKYSRIISEIFQIRSKQVAGKCENMKQNE